MVDGTYTFIVNDTYKGTFNVNHEMQNLLSIDMSQYNQCNHDAYGGYRDPNTPIDEFYDYPQDNHDDDNYYGFDYNNDNGSGNSMTDIESTTEGEMNSNTGMEVQSQSEVPNSETVLNDDEQSSNFKLVIFFGVVLSILLLVIIALIVVIYNLTKSRN